MSRPPQLPYRLLPVIAALATALVIGCGADPSEGPERALTTAVSAMRRGEKGPIRTIGHYVHHGGSLYG